MFSVTFYDAVCQEGDTMSVQKFFCKLMKHTYLPLSLIVVAGILSGCTHWLFPVGDRVEPEVYLIETEDGAQIALHRFASKPSHGEIGTREPILFCHGIMSNRYSFDLIEERSFPRHLASLGYDVWMLELRNSGAAAQSSLFGTASYEHSMDAYIEHDVRTAIETVLQQTDATRLHWVGHSMGSMVLYGYVSRFGDEKLASIVSFGGPPQELFDGNIMMQLGVKIAPLVTGLLDQVPSGSLVKMNSLGAWPAVLPQMHLIWNYDNVDADTARLAAAHAVDNVASGVLEQFRRAARRGVLTNDAETHSYTGGLEKVSVPIMFVAGANDQLAAPALMRRALSKVRSEQVQFEVLSRANGYSHDYGHVDMLLGVTAAEEVLPLLVDWFVERENES